MVGIVGDKDREGRFRLREGFYRLCSLYFLFFFLGIKERVKEEEKCGIVKC